MDSFELNKIAGAVLGAVLLIFGISILSEQLFHAEAPETPGYVIEVSEAGHGDEQAGDAAEPEESIASLLASADADAGVSVFKKCAACHTANEGGANKVGPNLWNIVNRATASVDGFSYSGPMADLGGGGGTWSFDALNAFLIKPKDFLKGTKMAFAGIKKPGDRANLIAYLRSLSASPAELPAAEPMMEPAAEAEMEKDANADGHDVAADGDTASAAPASDAAHTDTAAMKPADEAEAAKLEETMAATEPAKPVEPAADTPQKTEAIASTATEPPAEAAMADASPVLAMIGSADVATGKKVAKKCKACHSFDEGGKKKVGPPLWGVVNGPVAAFDGFKYSSAMTAYGEDNGTWTFANLDTYLANPKGTVPKTKMAFAGVKKDGDRAALLAYLRSLAAEPAPLP